MTLQQLKYVITVAETGTITEAANKLYISQPSLTNAIHELEKEMNLVIFNRTNKGISPFNAWQIFRGSVTFPLRMERINQSAQKIAEWLEERENVTFVSYPGLTSHPGHETAAKQMKNGYGGVISFGLNTDDKTVEHFCAALKVVTFAVSLGHDESLIFPQPSYDERINLYPEKFRKGFIRFSVGLEDPDDIIKDLERALKSINL